MSVFKFRLEPLLRVRRAERDGRRIDFRDAQRAEAVLREELTHLARQAAQARREASIGIGVALVTRLLEAERYARALDEQQGALERRHAEIFERIETCRAALVQAEQHVRLLEQFRERQADQWRLDASRRYAA